MPNSIVKSFAKKTGKSVQDVEKLWDKAVGIAAKQGLAKDSEAFFAYTTGVLKKMLKLEGKLRTPPADLIEGYMDGTPHRMRAEPIGSASTIFKRDKFLRRRGEKDQKKVVSGKKKKGNMAKDSKRKEED